MVVTGESAYYGRTVAATGKDLQQARDNARRRFAADAHFTNIPPTEVISCGNGGWFAAIRGFSSRNQIGRPEVARDGYACGKASREEAVAEAMREYYRVGGISGLTNAMSHVGFASGTEFVWSGQSGVFVTGSPADRLQPCPIDKPCEYGPAVYWRDYPP